MYILILILSLLPLIRGDLVSLYEYEPSNVTNENNIVVASLWAMGMCSCIGLVCSHKNKIPVLIHPIEDHNETKKYQIDFLNFSNDEYINNIYFSKNLID